MLEVELVLDDFPNLHYCLMPPIYAHGDIYTDNDWWALYGS